MAPVLNGSAFITGAASGIGRACVLEFVRSGSTGIVITDIDEANLNETVRLAQEIDEHITIIAEVADIGREGVADRLVQRAASEFGRLDYALNVAGVSGKQAAIADLSIQDYNGVMDVNAKGVWLCERAEISQMVKQTLGSTHDGRPGNRGAIVNIASICGIVGLPHFTPYTMSKHAVVGLTKCDSTSYASQGIRINAVCPGMIDTPIFTEELRKSAVQLIEAFAPMRRLGTAQEIADVAAFLCSSRASYASGASFIVDGGFTAQ